MLGKRLLRWKYLVAFCVALLVFSIIAVSVLVRNTRPLFIDRSGRLVQPPPADFGKDYMAALVRLYEENHVPSPRKVLNLTKEYLWLSASQGRMDFCEGLNPVCIADHAYYLDRQGFVQITVQPAA